MLRKFPLHPPDQPIEHAVKGKVIYLLALIGLVQFGYPITAYGQWALILYQFLYASMIIAGVIVGRDSRRPMRLLATSGFIYFIAGMYYSLNPAATFAVFIAYLALIPYLSVLVWVLLRFLSIVRTITRDVIYAAIAVYLLLGAIFVPLYGLLETLLPASFRDSSREGMVQWQQLIYFSYTTLTTAGYGDVQPVTWWARSLANVEMVVGVLYITIIMAQLVGLYVAAKTAAAEAVVADPAVADAVETAVTDAVGVETAGED